MHVTGSSKGLRMVVRDPRRGPHAARWEGHEPCPGSHQRSGGRGQAAHSALEVSYHSGSSSAGDISTPRGF